MKNKWFLIIIIMGIISNFTIAVCLSIESADSNVIPVETFVFENYKIKVQFFDHSFDILKTPGYKKLTPREQANCWVVYQQKSAIYQFELINSENKVIRYFIVHGDPNKKNTSFMYKLESVDAKNIEILNPNKQDYSKHVVNTYPLKSTRGVLFENMKMFQSKESNKDIIGNGIQISPGIYDRVTPYTEVKDEVSKIIQEEISIK